MHLRVQAMLQTFLNPPLHLYTGVIKLQIKQNVMSLEFALSRTCPRKMINICPRAVSASFPRYPGFMEKVLKAFMIDCLFPKLTLTTFSYNYVKVH